MISEVQNALVEKTFNDLMRTFLRCAKQLSTEMPGCERAILQIVTDDILDIMKTHPALMGIQNKEY